MAESYSWSTTTGWASLDFESVDTPNFLTLRNSGGDLPYNPHFREEVRGTSPLGWRKTGGPVTERTHRPIERAQLWALTNGYYFHGSEKISYPKISELENDVAIRLLTKVRESEINLGVTMGEFGETAEFVSQAMVRTWRAFRYTRQGRLQKALETLTGRKNLSFRDIPGVVADSWLAFAFGFRPLAQDVYGAIQILDKGLRAGPAPYIFNTRLTKDLTKETIGSPSSERFSGQLICSGRVRVVVTDPVLYQLEQLGLTNPALVAWELVPFSFVVDWFVPINSYIQNIFPPQGVDFVDGYTYTKVEGTAQYWTQFYDLSGSLTWDTSASEWTKMKNRKVLSSWPTPSLIVPDLSLSKQKVATGMSLLYSLSESVIRGR